jgi:hypothetical protein
MSYSVCLNCKEMVKSYEKYCDKCSCSFKQDVDFWKNNGYDIYKEPNRSKHLQLDTKAEKEEK